MGPISWRFRELSYLPTCPLETHIQPKRCWPHLPFILSPRNNKDRRSTGQGIHASFHLAAQRLVRLVGGERERGRERENSSPKQNLGNRSSTSKITAPSTGQYLYLHSCDWHWRSPHVCVHRHQLQLLQRFLINTNFAVVSLEDSGEHDVNSVGNQTWLSFASSRMALLLTVQQWPRMWPGGTWHYTVCSGEDANKIKNKTFHLPLPPLATVLSMCTLKLFENLALYWLNWNSVFELTCVGLDFSMFPQCLWWWRKQRV